MSVWASSNITAGSDTTAILLRTLFYNLLTHPESLAKLHAELDEAASTGNLDEFASWKQTRDLPYLDACIKEAGRLHPPFGLPYERIVPAEGATICGKFIPGGTVVGMSAWATHRDRIVFGADCDIWNPQRWIDSDKEQKRKMENGLLTVSVIVHLSCFPASIIHTCVALLTFRHLPIVRSWAPILPRQAYCLSRNLQTSAHIVTKV